MDNIFLIAGIIAFIYLLFKFLEMRIVDKGSKPLKILVRDALLVYVSVVFGTFVINQLNQLVNETEVPNVPLAFTDNPPF